MKDKYSKRTRSLRTEIINWPAEDIRYFGYLALYKVVTTPWLFKLVTDTRCPARGHDNTKGKHHGKKRIAQLWRTTFRPTCARPYLCF